MTTSTFLIEMHGSLRRQEDIATFERMERHGTFRLGPAPRRTVRGPRSRLARLLLRLALRLDRTAIAPAGASLTRLPS